MSPDTSFRRMRTFFASPVSAAFGFGSCRLRFRKLGLDASFISFDDGLGTAATCDFFGDAVATGPEWLTAKGIRVGATLRALRRAYPGAFRRGAAGGENARVVGGGTVWELTQASGHHAQTILVAYVRRGRVVALGVYTVGH